MAVLNVNVDFFIIIGETQEVYGLPLYLFDIFNNAEQTKEKDASHAGGVLLLFILIIVFLNNVQAVNTLKMNLTNTTE